MNILQISPMVPFPTDLGGRMGIAGILMALSNAGHHVTFLCYKNQTAPSESEHIIRKYALPLIVELNTENNFIKMIFNLFSKLPYNFSKYKTRKMKKVLENYLATEKPDIVHLDHAHLLWTVDVIQKKYPLLPIVVREHNFEANLMKRFYGREKNILIKLYAFYQYKKMILYEPNQCSKTDCSIMISEADKNDLLHENASIKTAIIPAGIHLPDKMSNNKIAFSICHIGPMDWLPNYDSATWFLDKIYPNVVRENPNIMFYLIGKGTEKIKIADQLKPFVTAKGYVEDFQAEFSKMMLLIVPLRIGGGIRIKILEAMASRINILTTSIGCEGLPVVNQNHLLIADSEKEISSTIISFFNDTYNREKMLDNSYRLIKEKFSWESVGEQFIKTYQQAINEKK